MAKLLIDMRGCIGKAIINDDQTLILRGWVGSTNGGIVDRFSLQIGDQEITDFAITQGLPSLDVEKLYPQLHQAANLRFQITINSANLDKFRDKLVTLIPYFQEQQGGTLFNIIAPSLPLPNREDLLAIGDDMADDNGMSFKASACAFLQHFVDYADLKPTDAVLDIGCGIGRIAYALAYYLKPTGRYVGVDIVQKWINWNRSTISSKYPHFQFDLADIYNQIYNPHGKLKAIDYIFPYPDQSFNFVFLASVFTHIWEAEVRHYLQEISRVLVQGGKCLCSFFLLNDESLALMAAGKSSLNFVYAREHCFYAQAEMPEYAIAYPETLILQWIQETGLELVGKYDGWWCQRTGAHSYQDLLVLSK